MTFTSSKRLWFAVAVVYFTAGYLLCNWFNGARSHYYDPGFPFEAKIPFIPVFILGYLLVYLCILGLYFLIDDAGLFRKVVKAFFILTTVHYVLFLLLPVKMAIRPAITAPADLTGLVGFYYWLDKPYNCFPSLHVAYAFLGTIAFWRYKRGWGYAYLAATIIVLISVIFVKQHYLLDVAFGYITPLAVWRMTRGICKPVCKRDI